MANYYLSGYSTPDGVESREDVKQYQRMLGVTADGIWGPVTQAAYRNYTANTATEAMYSKTITIPFSAPFQRPASR